MYRLRTVYFVLLTKDNCMFSSNVGIFNEFCVYFQEISLRTEKREHYAENGCDSSSEEASES